MTWPGISPEPAKKATDTNSPEKLSSDAHARSDLDSGYTAQHHTLGISANQSSPGDHQHDGSSSRKISADDINGLFNYIFDQLGANGPALAAIVRPYIMSGATFTGSRNSDAWRQQVMDGFEGLGATDSTSA